MLCNVLSCALVIINSIYLVLCFSDIKKGTADFRFCYMFCLLLLLNCVKFDCTEALKSLFSKGKTYFYLTLFPPALDNLILSCLTSLILYNFFTFHMECLIKSVSLLLFCDINSKAE